MTIHVHVAVVTTHGTASNNRGVTEGNTTTLQKLVWNGAVHTCVSAEAIRFALRRALNDVEPCNRTYNEELRRNEWQDPSFERWADKAKERPFIDDDLLGYMMADRGIHLDEALSYIKKAVALDPQNGAYLDSLGWAYFKMGNYELAEENLRRAVDKANNDPTVLDHLGDLFQKTDRLKLAAASWERALQEWTKTVPAEVDQNDVAKVQKKLDAARVKLAKESSGAAVK